MTSEASKPTILEISMTYYSSAFSLRISQLKQTRYQRKHVDELARQLADGDPWPTTIRACLFAIGTRSKLRSTHARTTTWVMATSEEVVTLKSRTCGRLHSRNIRSTLIDMCDLDS